MRIADDGPVDDEFLRDGTRPFDEAHRNAPGRARADGIEHLGVGDRRGVAVALQLEFSGIDAARDIRGKHEQQIDLLRLGRLPGQQQSGEDQAKIANSASHVRA